MGSGINNKIDEFLCNPKDVKKRRNKKPAAQRTLLHSKALSPEESAGYSHTLSNVRSRGAILQHLKAQHLWIPRLSVTILIVTSDCDEQ